MELLDRFSRTFLPAAFESGVPRSRVSRHAPVLRRCAGNRDTALLVAPCAEPNRPLGRTTPTSVLLLTRSRLVVTTESWLTHRLRLHLNAELHHLTDVTWTPEPAQGALKLSATAIDGVREHFWLKLGTAERVREVDALLTAAFRGGLRRARAARTERPASGQLAAA